MQQLSCHLGSHDSFTYWVDVHAPVGPDQKLFVKYLATVFSVLAKKVMVKWSMTQVITLDLSKSKWIFSNLAYCKYLQVFFAVCCYTVSTVIIHRIWHFESSWMQESATLISGYPPNLASLDMRSTSSMAYLATRWAVEYNLPIAVGAFQTYTYTIVLCIMPQVRHLVTVL